MKQCLDTDIVIEYLRGTSAIVSKINDEGEKYYITPITFFELYYGAYRSVNTLQKLKEIQELFTIFDILEFTPLVYNQFGKLKTLLKERGEMIDNFDLIIASFCIAHDKFLVTNNEKHFARIPGLQLEQWN